MSSAELHVDSARETMESMCAIHKLINTSLLTIFIVVYEISKLLNTGLDRETLSILINLCEYPFSL